jgi:multiple sugar transport system permease protein
MKRLKPVLGIAAALLVAMLFLFPLLWIVMASFKTKLELLAVPPVFIFKPTIENYLKAFNSDFPQQILNSLIIAVSSGTVSIILGSLTAYGFSRYQIRSSDFVQFWILSLRMLPPIAVVVPFYLVFRALDLLDTHIALILVYCLFNISFAVWVLKGFFDEIPLELEEAAMLDGYSPPQIFLRVALPLARSGLATTAVFCLIQSLNEFLLAVSLTTRRAETAPVGLSKVQTLMGVDWGLLSAAAVLFVLPIVIFTILVRNELVRGMSFGRMK